MPEASLAIENLGELIAWTLVWLVFMSLNSFRLLYDVAKNSKAKKITVADIEYVLANNALFTAGFILFTPWQALVVIVIALAIGSGTTILLLKVKYPNGGEIK